MRIVWFTIAAYIAITAFAYFFQHKLLYFPKKSNPDTLKTRAAEANLVPWPGIGSEYLGLIGSAPLSSPAGTIIVFHGNAGCALDRAYYHSALAPLGFRVILAEYPGYGARGGVLGEKHFVQNACKILHKVKSEFSGPIFLWGESLGCGVVTKAATLSNVAIDGIVLLTPWDTLPNVAQSHYWFLPARWLLKDRYDNIDNLRGYNGPVAVIKAGKDEVIPCRFTDNLYKAIKSSKKLWTFENAGHNSWPAHTGLSWWSEVMKFLTNNKLDADNSHGRRETNEKLDYHR